MVRVFAHRDTWQLNPLSHSSRRTSPTWNLGETVRNKTRRTIQHTIQYNSVVRVFAHRDMWQPNPLFHSSRRDEMVRNKTRRTIQQTQWHDVAQWYMKQDVALLFLVSASAPQLVEQRTWYVLSCLWDDAYKRTCVANRSAPWWRLNG